MLASPPLCGLLCEIPRGDCLRAQGVAHALAASADQRVRGGKDTGLRLGVLLDLRHSVDNTGDKTDDNGGNTGEGDWGIEKDETRQSDGKLVEGANHGVSGGRGDTNTPGGGVGDKDGRKTGQNHGDHDAVTVVLGEVAGQVGRRPVFEKKGSDEENRDGEQVVVEHG